MYNLKSKTSLQLATEHHRISPLTVSMNVEKGAKFFNFRKHIRTSRDSWITNIQVSNSAVSVSLSYSHLNPPLKTVKIEQF
jgi:hypothetical protein